MENDKPTAKEMMINEEFVYATRIVDTLKKVDLSKPCDIEESIKMIEKTFIEFKYKVLNKL